MSDKETKLESLAETKEVANAESMLESSQEVAQEEGITPDTETNQVIVVDEPSPDGVPEIQAEIARLKEVIKTMVKDVTPDNFFRKQGEVQVFTNQVYQLQNNLARESLRASLSTMIIGVMDKHPNSKVQSYILIGITHEIEETLFRTSYKVYLDSEAIEAIKGTPKVKATNPDGTPKAATSKAQWKHKGSGKVEPASEIYWREFSGVIDGTAKASAWSQVLGSLHGKGKGLDYESV